MPRKTKPASTTARKVLYSFSWCDPTSHGVITLTSSTELFGTIRLRNGVVINFRAPKDAIKVSQR